MTTAAFAAFLHHAAAFLLVGAVMVELVLLRGELTVGSMRSLLRMDRLYGISAALVLIVGFYRVFHTEKGPDYYFGSGPFIAKLSLFIAVGLLSIYPTKVFLGWRKELKAERAPVLAEAQRHNLRRVIHLELLLLFVIMLCAALMARGIGFIGRA
jgi:putative membrane protein